MEPWIRSSTFFSNRLQMNDPPKKSPRGQLLYSRGVGPDHPSNRAPPVPQHPDSRWHSVSTVRNGRRVSRRRAASTRTLWSNWAFKRFAFGLNPSGCHNSNTFGVKQTCLTPLCPTPCSPPRPAPPDGVLASARTRGPDGLRVGVSSVCAGSSPALNGAHPDGYPRNSSFPSVWGIGWRC